jgi:hypothetical protein
MCPYSKNPRPRLDTSLIRRCAYAMRWRGHGACEFERQLSAKIEISIDQFWSEGLHLQQAGAGLEKIMIQSLRQAAPAEAPLLAWPVVCGSVVAERTRALSFDRGVLRVEVASPRWNSELRTLAPRYLAAINRYTTEKVSRIEFVVARPKETPEETKISR